MEASSDADSADADLAADSQDSRREDMCELVHARQSAREREDAPESEEGRARESEENMRARRSE